MDELANRIKVLATKSTAVSKGHPKAFDAYIEAVSLYKKAVSVLELSSDKAPNDGATVLTPAVRLNQIKFVIDYAT